jgi:D-beta-D-heptose 7-phosphate kinase / D-beta-D-heptose 1-phosphate adenosyltransferase
MHNIFPDYHSAKVAVIGDIMLDRYFYGDVTRISPEAPVPVVQIKREECSPGGAANVAVNLVSLGVTTSLSGLVGDDADADQLQAQLSSINVACELYRSTTATTVKSRIMGGMQQFLRMDFESIFSDNDWAPLWARAQQNLVDADIIVLSDYNKGTLSNCQAVINYGAANNIPVVVDPKGSDFNRYAGAALLTPNLTEFIAIVGPVDSEQDMAIKAQRLIKKLNVANLLVTRSEKGMTLFRPDQNPFHLPALSKEVADVTGAGDTVIATVAASLAAGADMETAVSLANIAASNVVSKIGTNAITAPELELAFLNTQQNHGALSIEQLCLAVELAKKNGEKVVFTNGCFDILHAGHVAYLQQARALGDRLIVAINTDESVTRIKGEGRPINSLERRLAVLEGLQSVNWVSGFEGDTPEELIAQLQPSILVKGGDYTEEQVVGREIVEGYGGEVRVMSMVSDCSTTEIITKSKN